MSQIPPIPIGRRVATEIVNALLAHESDSSRELQLESLLDQLPIFFALDQLGYAVEQAFTDQMMLLGNRVKDSRANHEATAEALNQAFKAVTGKNCRDIDLEGDDVYLDGVLDDEIDHEGSSDNAHQLVPASPKDWDPEA